MNVAAHRSAVPKPPPRRLPATLVDRVQYLPGVGPKRAEQLSRLGIGTAGDLLEYLPLRHERHEYCTIEHLEEGGIATIIGQIRAIRVQGGRGGSRVSATLVDNTGRCSLTWFNARYVADKLEQGTIIRATGRVTEFMQLPQLVNPRFEVLGPDAAPVDESKPAQLEPVYPATLELPSRVIRRLIAGSLDRLIGQVVEWYPQRYLAQRKLMPRRQALLAMHRPQDPAELADARVRLAYDELFLMQLVVSLSRRHRSTLENAGALLCSDEMNHRIRRRFPFPLTRGQDRAIRDIVGDLAQTRPMNRLLQGDVGCGKTVVALYAALVAVANRRQVAIMAPTELLAEQHNQSISRYLAGSRVSHAMLVGGVSAKKRRDMLAAIERGETSLVVGTHALVQGDVQFRNLGLVVVDEQHRFGVRQRATIRGKGAAPHYLVMTATPIPRTLAMTVFGDLDVTTIDDMPPGRSPVATRVVGPGQRGTCWEFVRSQLSVGRQAYVVYPVIDETDNLEIKAAASEFKRLGRQEFASWRVGLLHGRLDQDERGAVMRDFVEGRISVLVSTTVIEVGIDVPNATCMVIEHAERYGLSQLHQMRGRVGRGSERGYCFLMTDSAAAAENERLSVLAGTTDGFKIAEEDLRLRGPGEMLGTRQHGLPELRVADLIADADLLRAAQRDAAQLVREDPTLTGADHRVLRERLLSKNQDMLRFIGAG